jgi:hypothetical protein
MSARPAGELAGVWPIALPPPRASNPSPRREIYRVRSQNRRLPLWRNPLRNRGRTRLQPALPLPRLPTPERCSARPRRSRPQRRVPILQGAPKRYVTKADSGNDIVRIFCGDCGTPLYVQVGTRPDLIGLRVCTLDDPSWFKPDADIFMKSAQPWDHDEPNVPKYDTYPSGQSYPTAPSRDG